MRQPTLWLLALAYLAFISLGLPDTVLGITWPSLRETFDASEAGLGGLLAAVVAGHFTSGLFAGRLVLRFSVGGLLALSTGLVALGLAGYALAPAWLLFFPLAMLIGLGSGAIDSGLNAYASKHFPVRHLNWLHACWSVGATFGPIIMTGVLARGLTYRSGYGVLAAMLAVMALVFVLTRRTWTDGKRIAADAKARALPSRPPAGAWQTLRRRRVLLQVAIFFIYTGLESGAGQWCFTFMREARGVSIEAAGSWTAAYWGSLLTGRVALAFIIDRVGPDRLLRVTTFTAMVGALMFAFLSGPSSALGLLVLGGSLAPLYPTLMARTDERLGSEATVHAIGFQVAAATLGAATLPGALGLWIAAADASVIPIAIVIGSAVLLGLHELLLRVTR